MTEEKSSHFWRNLGGILVGVAAVVSAGVAVHQAMDDDKGDPEGTTSAIDSTDTASSRCAEPWVWDAERQNCVRHFTIPRKTLSVRTDRAIAEVSGRIDFYLNTKRLPGTDAQGRAIYEAAKGSVQVVIPIMQGTTMVGDVREVVFSTNDGVICSIAGLPEATGHMKAMQVKYFLRLDQCGEFCKTSVAENNRRVHIDTSPLNVTVAESC